MKQISFGKTKITVPAVAVGCMRIAGMTQNEADRFIKEAVGLGASFFDHADIYGGGSCEELFGKILKENPGLRQKITLQSKAGIVPGVMYDNSAEYLTASVDAILKRLKTDYLDVFLIHRPDVLADPAETARALDALIDSGKVKYAGVSNHRTSRIALLSEYMEHDLTVSQMQLGLMHAPMIQEALEADMATDGAADRDGGMIDYCMQNKLTIQAWSPFQYGMIQGTFLGNPDFPEINARLDELAGLYHTTGTAIAAAWILRHPANIQILAGSTNIDRLREICNADQIPLTKQEWYSLYLAAGHMLP